MTRSKRPAANPQLFPILNWLGPARPGTRRIMYNVESTGTSAPTEQTETTFNYIIDAEVVCRRLDQGQGVDKRK